MVNLVPPLSVVLILLTCSAARLLLQKRRKLPPGPPRLPVLGNALQIPTTQPWKTFADWGKSYGPVSFAEALGRSMIIINSVTAARDLMDKKGAIFSNRPNMPVLGMTGLDITLPLLQYGSTHQRKQRRLMQEYLGSSHIRSLDSVVEGCVQKFLKRLLISPDDFYQEILGHVAGIILEAVYGHKVSCNPSEDRLIKVNEQALSLITATGNFGSTTIDTFPFLRHLPAWLPGMDLKRKAQMARNMVLLALSLPFEEARSRKASGNVDPALIYEVLDKYKSMSEMSSQEETDIRIFAGTFYLAGTETTRIALITFVFMMVSDQKSQKRAQEEIDRNIGLHRLPSFSDRAKLPFIDCLMKEVLRIHPPIPLGIPHESTRTDEYHNWDLPGRSTIIPNIWQMMRDVKSFPNPEKFDPDRHMTHLEHKHTDDSASFDPVAPVFGFGRRVCPGRAFAESVMWITISNVLAAFTIMPWKDPVTGEEALPIFECESDIVNIIKPFKCRIVPRKDRLTQIIRDN
ncbi:hypothetical protein ACEPAG_9341 [Sanghuangporus baumii]